MPEKQLTLHHTHVDCFNSVHRTQVPGAPVCKQVLDYGSSHWSLFWSYSQGLGICYITQGSFELKTILLPELGL